MKRIRFSTTAEDQLTGILATTIDRFGQIQAERYAAKIDASLRAAAAGEPPHPRPCSTLFGGEPDAGEFHNLSFVRVGSHFLILDIADDRLDVVAILHARSNLETHLAALSTSPVEDDDRTDAPGV